MSLIKSKEEFFQGVTGFYSDLSFEEYKSLKAINSSALKEISYSPLHCRYAFENGREDTDSLSLGRVSHIAIFEPERFKNLLIMPEFSGLTKDGKESKQSGEAQAKKKNWQKENEGREIVEREEYNTANLLAQSCANHSGARKLLERESYNELSGVWSDAETGLLCKMRVDRFINYPEGGKKIPTILDVKTTNQRVFRNAKNIDTHEKMRTIDKLIFNYQYYFSKSFYLRGIDAILQKEEKAESVLIFVETNAPFGVLPVKLHKEWIHQGNLQIDAGLKLFKECQDSGNWYGYEPEMVLSIPPSYFFRQE